MDCMKAPIIPRGLPSEMGVREFWLVGAPLLARIVTGPPLPASKELPVVVGPASVVIMVLVLVVG